MLHSPTFRKPHTWFVYLTKSNQLRAALIKTKKDLDYYKARRDIASSILITAFTRTEAWHKGKEILKHKFK